MDIFKTKFKYSSGDTVCGLVDELQILYYLNYYNNHDDNVLILTNSLYEANQILKKIKIYTENVYLFPMDDFLSSVAIAISPDLKVVRLNTLESIKKNKKSIIVTNLTGYLKYLPNINESKNFNIEIEKDEEISRDELIEKLIDLGYKETSLVTSTGEYAVRGFIIDVFPIEDEHPIRIEFFGDNIDSIRVFDEDSQLSLNEIKNKLLRPYEEIINDNHSCLVDYLNNPFVFIVNKSQIDVGLKKLYTDMIEYKESNNIDQSFKYMYDYEDIILKNYMYIETVNNINGSLNYNSKQVLKFNGNFDMFKDYIIKSSSKYNILICISKDSLKDYIEELLDNVNNVKVVNKKINEGFILDDIMVVSEYDITDEKVKTKYTNNYKIGTKIKDYNDLNIGDYVVHKQHGIGVYNGINMIERNGMKRDYIVINYLNNDKVYVPVDKIDTIFKYSDKDGGAVSINSLNSTQWEKVKNKVRSKIKDISQELIKLYAARNNTKCDKYKDYEEEVIFANDFIYDETKDQKKCIHDILVDLNKDIPMDRLLCGDVGFGKTEVAFRAMFKAVINNKQVAYLCPTTLLSRQQYYNALERFKSFPVRIELLNRFTSVKDCNRIIRDINDGKVDIVIGTHKLLNDAIRFNDLGLLVIDEEQRFGVTHKEKIKELKNDVNVLTLSATPIPRTLKMAMSGLRDLSIIDTPPVNRYPIQTYVLEENTVIIKDAIYKELSRDGQIFILYNNVEGIVDFSASIQSLIPEANVVYAHGQMDKKELENIVADFIDNKFNILVCTTIIETGIDIPNVNTLIVIDSDKFGLSQLYQLRGRVGRSDKIAYAYLTYKKQKILTETAVKRLNSIKDFTELGSGYKIAMRDMAIRGSGDLLGSEQAGFIDSVGLELYTQMVNEELKRLNGEEIKEEEDKNALIEVDNHISDDYVKDESLKIEIHKMINSIDSKEQLENISKEIKDRFGTFSEELEIYMYEEWFEKLAESLNIKNVINTNNTIEIELPEEVSSSLDGEKLFFKVFSINPKFNISYRSKKIYIKLTINNLNKHFIYYLVELLNVIKEDVNK